jgi:hypothetical protein
MVVMSGKQLELEGLYLFLVTSQLLVQNNLTRL